MAPGQDIVYVNLDGQLEPMSKRIVESMDATNLNRLIFIISMGVYNEVPGHDRFGSILDPYRQATTIVEASKFDYTRTQRGEPFKGSEISRKSVAALVVK